MSVPTVYTTETLCVGVRRYEDVTSTTDDVGETLSIKKEIKTTFRLENENEIEHEYSFSMLALMLSIITFKNNLVLIVSYSTGHQQGGVRALAVTALK